VCWFILDIVFYSVFTQKDIYAAVREVAAKADTMNALQEMSKIAHTQTVVTLCGTIPGYWYTIFIDIIEQFAIPSSSGAYSASHDGFIVMHSPSSLPTLKWPRLERIV
jgi:hypothetical protein